MSLKQVLHGDAHYILQFERRTMAIRNRTQGIVVRCVERHCESLLFFCLGQDAPPCTNLHQFLPFVDRVDEAGQRAPWLPLPQNLAHLEGYSVDVVIIITRRGAPFLQMMAIAAAECGLAGAPRRVPFYLTRARGGAGCPHGLPTPLPSLYSRQAALKAPRHPACRSVAGTRCARCCRTSSCCNRDSSTRSDPSPGSCRAGSVSSANRADGR